MKLHCREGSVFFYFEESQISATEKKNKAISLGNSYQEVIVSSRDWAIKKPKLGHEGELALQDLRHLRHLSHVTSP